MPATIKASELDPEMFPRKEVIQAYEKAGQNYDPTIHDRTYAWWYPLIKPRPSLNKDLPNLNGDRSPTKLIDQDIQKVIFQLYRTKDQATGNEYLFYNVDLIGRDWKGNRKDFSYVEGIIDGFPIFNYEIDPTTNEIVAGTTQVDEIIKKFTIPFTKAKVDEISKFFRTPLSCIVVAPDSRRYSVSLEQFKNMNYNELIDLVTGFSEFIKSRRGSKVYQ